MDRAAMRAVLLVALMVASGILWLSSSLLAADILVHNGFMTGNTYLSWSQTNQNTYVTGLVDGIFLAPLFNAPKSGPISNAEGCLENKTNTQLRAIFNKHLDDHPERWEHGAHILFYSALVGFCDLARKK